MIRSFVQKIKTKPLELIPRKWHIKLKLSDNDVNEQLKGSSNGHKTSSCSDLISWVKDAVLEPLEQRADRLGRQTCCSWRLKVLDSTLSFFPFGAAQLRCAACFPSVRVSQKNNQRRSLCGFFSPHAGSFLLYIYQV